MEDSDKLPLKRVELSLSKFNEVAIPHHLDLLRQHRANIIKYEECGDYNRVSAEQTNARRVSAQLRSLLSEVEALRRRVREQDLPAFDDSTQRARDLTLRAICDYLETSPLSANRRPAEDVTTAVVGSATSSDSVGVLPFPPGDDEPLIQLQVNEQELSMREREAMLRGWSALQAEVRALHDVWQHVHTAAMQQRTQVTSASSHVESSADNVQVARTHLSSAERLRGGALALGGACCGLAVGGPAGLLLGAKAGAAAALLGSLLGYVGVRAAFPRRRVDEPVQVDESNDSAADHKCGNKE